MSLFDLTGRRALVSGASRGLGLQMAGALARAGADLVITARDTNSLKKPRRELETHGHQVDVVALDLQHDDSICEAVENATASGSVAILLSTAGCNIRKPAMDVRWEDWNTILDTNLRCLFFMTQRVVQPMLPQPRGRVINLGSMPGLVGD